MSEGKLQTVDTAVKPDGGRDQAQEVGRGMTQIIQRIRTWCNTPLRDGHWFARFYNWFWGDDPIAQRFRIGYAVVSALGLGFYLFVLGLLAGRSGL